MDPRDHELKEFLKEKLNQGVSEKQLIKSCINAGWKEDRCRVILRKSKRQNLFSKKETKFITIFAAVILVSLMFFFSDSGPTTYTPGITNPQPTPGKIFDTPTAAVTAPEPVPEPIPVPAPINQEPEQDVTGYVGSSGGGSGGGDSRGSGGSGGSGGGSGFSFNPFGSGSGSSSSSPTGASVAVSSGNTTVANTSNSTSSNTTTNITSSNSSSSNSTSNDSNDSGDDYVTDATIKNLLNPPSGFNYYALDGNIITSMIPGTVYIRNSLNKPVISFDITGQIDLSSTTLMATKSTVVFHGFENLENVSSTYIMYIPVINENYGLFVCPGAADVESVVQGCSSYLNFTGDFPQAKQGITVSIITDQDDQYYKVSGLTGTGIKIFPNVQPQTATAVNVDPGFPGRWTEVHPPPLIEEAEGTNVTMLNMTSTLSTSRWQAYYGEVEGRYAIGLQDNIFFDFGQNFGSNQTVAKMIYTSVNENFPFALTTNITRDAVDVAYRFNETSVDSATVTLNQVLNLSIMQVAGVIIEGNFSTSVIGEETISNDLPGGPMNYSWASPVFPNQLAFRDETNDYQMLVPVNQSSVNETRVNNFQVYYFFVELE